MEKLRERPAGADHLAAIDRAIARVDPPSAMRGWFETYAAGHRRRFAQDLALIDALAPGRGPLVEFGVVPPVLTAALVERGMAVTGVDLAPERFERSLAGLGCPVIKCDFEREPLPLPDGAFDVALFNEIFEHLRIDLPSTFAELRRVLRPGGLLFLSTPNLRSLRGIVSLVLRGRSAWCCPDIHAEWSKIATLGHMGHVREYTARDVTGFLRACGFEPIVVVHRGTPEGAAERALCALRPELLPFVTVVARRPVEG